MCCTIRSGHKSTVDNPAKVHYRLYINLLPQLWRCDLAALCFGVCVCVCVCVCEVSREVERRCPPVYDVNKCETDKYVAGVILRGTKKAMGGVLIMG